MLSLYVRTFARSSDGHWMRMGRRVGCGRDKAVTDLRCQDVEAVDQHIRLKLRHRYRRIAEAHADEGNACAPRRIEIGFSLGF